MPLSVETFNGLPNSQKYAVIEDHGVYLDAYHIVGKKKICLFSLFDYYVEVYYDQGSDLLRGAYAFTDFSRLDPFLADIDISQVYAGL
jgi:hypothetical protein